MGAEHKIDDAMSRDEKRYYAKVCLALHIDADTAMLTLYR